MENDLVNDTRSTIMASIRFRMLAVVATLCVFGTVMVYSASCVKAADYAADYLFFKKQLVWLGIGVVGLLVMSFLRTGWIRMFYGPLLLLTVGLLVAVRIPGIGTKVNHAYRWLRVGGFNMQPSEFAKLAMVIVVAVLLSKYRNGVLPFFKGFLPVAAIIGVVCGLIMLEPDFGTAALVGTVLLGMLVVGGAKFWHILILGLCGLPPAVYIGLTKFSHIANRIEAWRSGVRDGTGYQIWMSKVALGSGGVSGMGLGQGMSKLYYLPEAHTDFIFAIVGQELGFLGTTFVLCMFGIFIYEGIRLVRHCHDRFCGLCAFGLVTTIALQAVFNLAVVTGSIPPKGISLPFVSFGGSGICVALSAVGMLVAITRDPVNRPAANVATPLLHLPLEESEPYAKASMGDVA